MKNERITVDSKIAAWEKAASLFPSDYERNEFASRHAGYPIFSATDKTNGSFICDLGCRLELNIRHNDGTEADTINIWIEDRRYTAEEVRKIVTAKRKDLETISAIRQAAEVLNTDASDKVIELLARLEGQARAELEQFGI